MPWNDSPSLRLAARGLFQLHFMRVHGKRPSFSFSRLKNSTKRHYIEAAQAVRRLGCPARIYLLAQEFFCGEHFRFPCVLRGAKAEKRFRDYRNRTWDTYRLRDAPPPSEESDVEALVLAAHDLFRRRCPALPAFFFYREMLRPDLARDAALYAVATDLHPAYLALHPGRDGGASRWLAFPAIARFEIYFRNQPALARRLRQDLFPNAAEMTGDERHATIREIRLDGKF